MWPRPKVIISPLIPRETCQEEQGTRCVATSAEAGGRMPVGGTRVQLWYFHSCLLRLRETGLLRAAPAQLICACFTMVLIKSLWRPRACVRSSHQKSKQRPGLADSLIMWQSSAPSMTGTGMQLGWADLEPGKYTPPPTPTQHLTNNLFLASLKAPDRIKCHAWATCHC